MTGDTMRLPHVWIEWEYKTIALSDAMDADTDGKPLAEYGREGWQIVTIQGSTAVLQRPVSPTGTIEVK